MYKKKLPKIEDMSKEQLKAFVAKKRECDSKARSIVEEMLDFTLPDDAFLQRLPFISKSHYEDVTVERAIINKCGYALCSKILPDKLPKQKYMISTKTNQVYDITNRKNFCSSQCYRASEFIKEQLLTSPLWFREQDNVPAFKLLPLNTKGAEGEVVDISIIEKIVKKDTFTSLYDFTMASLNEVETEEPNTQDTSNTTEKMESKTDTLSTETKAQEKKTPASDNEKNKNALNKTQDTIDKDKIPKTTKKISKEVKLLGDVVEKTFPKVDPFISAGHKLEMKNTPVEITQGEVLQQSPKNMSSSSECPVIILQIEKSFGEWIGFETLFFIFGEKKMKELVSDKDDEIRKSLEKAINESSITVHSYNQYQKLYRKLNLLELEDKKYDQGVTGTKPTKGLPDYSILQEEGKMLDVKVKAYFKGEMEIAASQNSETNKIEEDDDDGLRNLPLMEKSNQIILRRKIFLKGLDKVLPDMLKALDVPPREISGDVQQLIATFKLEPYNIMFKTIQWNLIAMIIVKLLSIRNLRLNEQLSISTSNKHLQLLLMSYKLDFGYLDRLIWWLTDFDRIIKTIEK